MSDAPRPMTPEDWRDYLEPPPPRRPVPWMGLAAAAAIAAVAVATALAVAGKLGENDARDTRSISDRSALKAKAEAEAQANARARQVFRDREAEMRARLGDLERELGRVMGRVEAVEKAGKGPADHPKDDAHATP